MQLLTRIAQATGGDINPAPDKTQAQLSTTKSYAPLKQPLIVLAFCLFLFEIALRKLVYSEPD